MTAAQDPPTPLTYGSVVHLLQTPAGYLCCSGQLADPAFLGPHRVVTGDSTVNTGVNASKWRFVPLRTGPGWRTKFGTPVLVGDAVHLLNCTLAVAPHVPDGGYLDSCEQVSNSSILKEEVGQGFDATKVYAGVFVDPDWERGSGKSGSWTLVKDGAKPGDALYENDAVRLDNEAGSLVAYSQVLGSAEDFSTSHAEGNVTYAFTSFADDVRGAQRWTLVPVDFSTLGRPATG